jgi:hypothetical protein
VWGQPNTINNYPAGGVLYARNTTNEDWTELHAFDETHISASNTNYTHELTITPSYYNTYALVIKKVSQSNPGNTGVSVGELELFGIPEYDPDAAGMDVKVTSYPNVPNTDWLEVYYDAKDFSGTPTSITDKSGNNITATANNITIDATYNSFEFTESPKSNIIADNVSFVSGDESHSIVLWVRLKNGNSNNLLFDYRVAGGTSITGAATGLYIVNNNTRLQFFHQDTDKQIDFNFEQNRWYHITGTYAGGGGFTGSKIYIDGVDLGGIKSGSDSVLVLPTTGTITIGDYLYSSIGLGDGSIANFRLFNRAITSDEVWQLYSYQKEYFGHGDLGMTLKAGRLGIGTSEPRAALDVRGDLRVDGHAQLETLAPRYYSSMQRGTFHNVSSHIITGFDHQAEGYATPVLGWEVHINFNHHHNTAIHVEIDGGYLSTAPGTHVALSEVATRKYDQFDSAFTFYTDTFYIGSDIAHTHAAVYTVIRITNSQVPGIPSAIHTGDGSTVRYHMLGHTMYVKPGIGSALDVAIGQITGNVNARLHGIRVATSADNITGAYTVYTYH